MSKGSNKQPNPSGSDYIPPTGGDEHMAEKEAPSTWLCSACGKQFHVSGPETAQNLFAKYMKCPHCNTIGQNVKIE